MADSRIELLQRGVDAWNDGDLGAYLDTLHEDVLWVPLQDAPDFREAVRGREAVLELLRLWIEPWDRYEVQTIEHEQHGEAMVWTARHVASQDDTGMALEIELSACFRFRDDRVSEARYFNSKAEALEAAEAGE